MLTQCYVCQFRMVCPYKKLGNSTKMKKCAVLKCLSKGGCLTTTDPEPIDKNELLNHFTKMEQGHRLFGLN